MPRMSEAAATKAMAKSRLPPAHSATMSENRLPTPVALMAITTSPTPISSIAVGAMMRTACSAASTQADRVMGRGPANDAAITLRMPRPAA